MSKIKSPTSFGFSRLIGKGILSISTVTELRSKYKLSSKGTMPLYLNRFLVSSRDWSIWTFIRSTFAQGRRLQNRNTVSDFLLNKRDVGMDDPNYRYVSKRNPLMRGLVGWYRTYVRMSVARGTSFPVARHSYRLLILRLDAAGKLMGS